jgi:cyclopropane fatty-acyl-phospholipid synthase-like methyltransferase
MQTLCRFPDGKFFDADYFERGRESGKGWLQNYRWMPRRSFREALAIIDHLGLNESSRVLDVGCAKGFVVRALRELEIAADGCDISEYALSFAPSGCWHCEDLKAWEGRQYTHAFSKDVFEHNTPEQLQALLEAIAAVAPRLMAVVPMGDNGKYRISQYHIEITHIIAEDEAWWRRTFRRGGWDVVREDWVVPGIKDNWAFYAGGRGNRVYVLKRDNAN